jgi:hypothetical protein
MKHNFSPQADGRQNEEGRNVKLKSERTTTREAIKRVKQDENITR